MAELTADFAFEELGSTGLSRQAGQVTDEDAGQEQGEAQHRQVEEAVGEGKLTEGLDSQEHR